MKLSAPVYRLKRKAKLLSREENIPLHEALDRIAAREGFSGWSLLSARLAEAMPASELFARLSPGDLVLLGARPGHGKTLISLELAVEAMKSGHRSAFLTLEYTGRDVLDRFRMIGADWERYKALFEFDTSEAISADYIAGRLSSAARGTLVVIDYLQILDQRRDKPDLMTQVRTLKAFAQERGLIIVFISQIDRSYDPAVKPCPDMTDIRLPNPLDLGLFNKACFVNNGAIEFRAA
ncbi:DNA helicase [Rhizobium sp. BE258]|uniref:DNA helicase n=1 Tax=Rhizobium sp. BE258 TaxID=2817722 RepID=UPI0028659606|nr:DNA helicase [Rhizobium sp. BE258]MDR7142926.1 replicative DNA helicase [Rhizobium sp. BE258]